MTVNAFLQTHSIHIFPIEPKMSFTANFSKSATNSRHFISSPGYVLHISFNPVQTLSYYSDLMKRTGQLF